jgi:hypothetical protein
MINYKKADLNELDEILRCPMEFIREDMGPQTAETESTIQAQLQEYLTNPPYPIRMSLCYGPLGEQVEFFMER